MNIPRIALLVFMVLVALLFLLVYMFMPEKEQKRIRGPFWEHEAPGLDN